MIGLSASPGVNIDPETSIIWIDSDVNIRQSTELLEAQNWRVACFEGNGGCAKRPS